MWGNDGEYQMFVKNPGVEDFSKGKKPAPEAVQTAIQPAVKKVAFKPVFQAKTDDPLGHQGPACWRVCGTARCIKAINNGKCPGEVAGDDVTCITYRFMNSGAIAHAEYSGGTVRQMAF